MCDTWIMIRALNLISTMWLADSKHIVWATPNGKAQDALRLPAVCKLQMWGRLTLQVECTVVVDWHGMRNHEVIPPIVAGWQGFLMNTTQKLYIYILNIKLAAPAFLVCNWSYSPSPIPPWKKSKIVFYGTGGLIFTCWHVFELSCLLDRQLTCVYCLVSEELSRHV